MTIDSSDGYCGLIAGGHQLGAIGSSTTISVSTANYKHESDRLFPVDLPNSIDSQAQRTFLAVQQLLEGLAISECAGNESKRKATGAS